MELVDVATRSVDHAAHAIAALKAGKDVFLEKPIAVSRAEARKIERAAKRSEGNVYCRHNRRFEPTFVHVREIMDSGVLGQVHQHQAVPRHLPAPRGLADDPGVRRRTVAQLGAACHDHALQFLDSPVADMWSDLQRVAAAGDAEDCVRIILRGENGRIADVQIGGGMAVREPECTVHGSRGSIVVHGNEMHLRYLSPRQNLPRLRAARSTPANEAGFGNPEKLRWIEKTIRVKPRRRVDVGTTLWRRLYQSIRKGEPFPIKWEEALEVMRVVDGTRKGTAFALPPRTGAARQGGSR